MSERDDGAHLCLSASGSRGMGKTLLMEGLAHRRGVTRLIAVDVMDEYPIPLKVSSASELRKVVEAAAPSRPFRVRYVPEDMSEPDAVAYVSVLALAAGNMVVIVDEAHESLSVRNCPPEAIKLAKRGRHSQVALWASAQRPTDLHPSIRAELHASEAWYLRLAEWRDLDLVAQRRGPRFRERVARCPRLHAYRLLPAQLSWSYWRIVPPRDGRKHPRLVKLNAPGGVQPRGGSSPAPDGSDA